MCVRKTNGDIESVLWPKKTLVWWVYFFPTKEEEDTERRGRPWQNSQTGRYHNCLSGRWCKLTARDARKNTTFVLRCRAFKDNQCTDRANVLFSEVHWKDTSKAELYLGSMIHDRSLIVVTGGGGIKQMYGYHRRLVRDFCEYRFQGGRWEEVRDSHNLWSCSRSVWAILCSFPLHCCSCKLTVHNERKGCEAERERQRERRETKEHRVHGKHGVNKAWSCPFKRSKKPHCIVNWPAISNTDTFRKEACETLLL